MAVNTVIPAIVHYGHPTATMPYTPGGAIVAGWPVVIGNLVGIPTRAIPAGYQGSLNIEGGVYICVGDAAISAGKIVYWDDTNKKVTETASGNKFFGTTTTACSGDLSTCDVAHGRYSV